MSTETNTTPAAPERSLTVASATFLGVGAMVGAGIFALLGEAGRLAGSAVWLSFALSGFISVLQGYSFAKLGARFPSRAGTIEYLVQGFGRGHVTGTTAWLLMITLVIVSAMVAVSFGAYGADLLFGEDAAPWIGQVLAVGVIAAVTAVNIAGSSAVAKVTSVLVVVMLVVLAIFSLGGLLQFDSSLVAPETYPPFRQILASVAVTFFAFLGFGVIAFSAADIKEPVKRNLPIAMYAAILIATVTYVAVALAVFGTLTLQEVIDAGDNALAVAAEPIFGQAGFVAVSIVALLATSSSVNSNLYAATGATKALGATQMLPSVLARSVGSGGSVGLVVAAIATAVIAVTLDLTAIAALGSAVSLLIFMMAGLAHRRVIDETGANHLIVWAAILSALITFIAFIVSTWLDDPRTVVLVGVAVVGAWALDFLWSRIKANRPAPSEGLPPAV